MATRILEQTYRHQLLTRALHAVADDINANKIYDVDEHGAANAFLVRVQNLFAERGVRISDKMHNIAVSVALGHGHAEIARQLRISSAIEVSNMMVHFRILLTAQMPYIASRYPPLVNPDGATTVSQLFYLTSQHMSSYLELLHDLREGTL